MYSRQQLEDAYMVGVGVGLACGHKRLDTESTGIFAQNKMDEMLDIHVILELRDTDRVEAIL